MKLSISQNPAKVPLVTKLWQQTVRKLSSRYKEGKESTDSDTIVVAETAEQEFVPIESAVSSDSDSDDITWASETIAAIHDVVSSPRPSLRIMEHRTPCPSTSSIQSEEAFARKLVAGQRRVEHSLESQGHGSIAVTKR